VCVFVQNGERSNPPSAVQFRMGGCKGVLAVDPKLRDEDKIVIRPSMEKFKCNDYKLEVITFSRPRENLLFYFAISLSCLVLSADLVIVYISFDVACLDLE